MKKLLFILGLSLLGLTVQAQTTNVTVNVLVYEPTRTNQVSFDLTDLHIVGLSVAWEASKAANGTNALTFRGFVRQEVKDRLEPLKTEGRNYQLKSQKIDNILLSIQLNWDTSTAADRKLLTDWLAKYPTP